MAYDHFDEKSKVPNDVNVTREMKTPVPCFTEPIALQ